VEEIQLEGVFGEMVGRKRGDSDPQAIEKIRCYMCLFAEEVVLPVARGRASLIDHLRLQHN